MDINMTVNNVILKCLIKKIKIMSIFDQINEGYCYCFDWKTEKSEEQLENTCFYSKSGIIDGDKITLRLLMALLGFICYFLFKYLNIFLFLASWKKVSVR